MLRSYFNACVRSVFYSLVDNISLFFSLNRTWTLLKGWTYNYIWLLQRSSPQINLHASYQISETVFSWTNASNRSELFQITGKYHWIKSSQILTVSFCLFFGHFKVKAREIRGSLEGFLNHQVAWHVLVVGTSERDDMVKGWRWAVWVSGWLWKLFWTWEGQRIGGLNRFPGLHHGSPLGPSTSSVWPAWIIIIIFAVIITVGIVIIIMVSRSLWQLGA